MFLQFEAVLGRRERKRRHGQLGTGNKGGMRVIKGGDE